MNPSFELEFGPSSEPVSISHFLQSTNPADLPSLPEDATSHSVYSVSDVQEHMSNLWHNPEISGFLNRCQCSVASSLLTAQKANKSRPKAKLETKQDPGSDVQQLQKLLDAIQLKSWTLPAEATAFVRTPRNSDYNAHTAVKRAGPVQVGSSQVIILVTNYEKTTWGGIVQQSQHAFLSSQTLADLFDAIRCSHKLDDDTSVGCVVCIEGVLYGGGGVPAQRFLEFANKPNLQKSESTIHETTFRSLSLRVNEPYWLVHQGNCEHFLVVEQIRLVHPSDPTCGYPLMVQVTPTLVDLCRCCGRVPGSLSIRGDIRLAESPCIMCTQCWEAMGPSDSRNVQVFLVNG